MQKRTILFDTTHNEMLNIEDEEYVDFVEPKNTHSVSFKFYEPEPETETEDNSELEDVEF